MENGTASEAGDELSAGKPVLAWLSIHALPERNVDPCRLRFGEKFNVLLGLNATGKTTLLEVIAAAMSFNFSKFAEEPFDVEYELHLPSGTVHARVRNERTLPEILADLPHLHGGDFLKQSAEIRVTTGSPDSDWNIRANADGLQVAWQGVKASSAHPTPIGSDLLARALSLVGSTSHVQLPLALRAMASGVLAWSELKRFDEALGFFGIITGAAAFVEVARGQAIRSAVGVWESGFILSSLCDQIVDDYARRRFEDVDASSVYAENLPFLSKAATLLGFKTVRIELRLLQRKTSARQERLRFGDLRFTFERDDGSLITHAELSYGQKRLLSLLYYLEMHPHTVVADELVDGLHHRWIDDAIEAIGERQAFLASQNPLILDHLEFASPEEVASTFVVCRTEKRDGAERLVWANMADLDAERFFRAYEVDVQHVSEILLSKGLW